MRRNKSSANTLLPRSLKPASVLDRISAQLIDLCVLFLFSFCISFLFGSSGALISLAFGIIYFWLLQLIGGQTVGKKLLGIRLLSVHSQSLNILRLFIRETAGRILCLATLSLGYLGIVFRKDGRGLHDFMAGSIVVCEKQNRTTLSHFFGILFVVFLTLGASTYFVLFKTPVLAKVGKLLLHRQGLDIDTVSGNLEQGWRINSFYGSNSLFRYHLKGIQISVNKSEIYKNNAWRMHQISVDEIKLVVAPSTLDFNYFKSEIKSFRMNTPFSAYGMLSLKAFVDSLKIKKISISDGLNLNLAFEDLEIRQIGFQGNSLSFAGLTTGKSSQNKLDVSQMIYNFTDKKLLLKAKLSLHKSAYAPLTKDAQLSFSWSGGFESPERFRLLTFENRLSVDYFRNDLLITITGFSPSKYIKSGSSFRNINAKLRNSNCLNLTCLKKLQGGGSFYLGSLKINFKQNKSWFEGSLEEPIQFDYNDVVLSLFQPKTIFEIVSEETVSNYVSLLYFKKPMELLAEQEQSLVKRDQIYFKILRERFDPNRPRHKDTFLLRSPAELSEAK